MEQQQPWDVWDHQTVRFNLPPEPKRLHDQTRRPLPRPNPTRLDTFLRRSLLVAANAILWAFIVVSVLAFLGVADPFPPSPAPSTPAPYEGDLLPDKGD